MKDPSSHEAFHYSTICDNISMILPLLIFFLLFNINYGIMFYLNFCQLTGLRRRKLYLRNMSTIAAIMERLGYESKLTDDKGLVLEIWEV